MKRTIWSLLIAKGCFPRREQETGALFCSAAPTSLLCCVSSAVGSAFSLGRARRGYGWMGKRGLAAGGEVADFCLGEEIGYAERAESSSA